MKVAHYFRMHYFQPIDSRIGAETEANDRALRRTADNEVAVSDSTGIALQDSATVPREYERALAAGVRI